MPRSCLTPGSSGIVSAHVLLASAEKDTGIEVHPRPAEDALLEGAEAVYDRAWLSVSTIPARPTRPKPCF